MNLISNAELAARAGVDPWALQAKVATGDPAQVGSLAAAFYKASGDMDAYNTEQRSVKTYVSEGYTTQGTSPIDFDAQARTTAAAPDTLRQIAKLLDSVGTDLDTTMQKSAAEVAALETTLNRIDGDWTSFMQQIGHHLPPDDQDSVRQGYIDQAVSATKTHGGTIDHLVTGYEETVYGAQRTMSDLGYTPPVTVDDGYGDAAAYVQGLQAKARSAAATLLNNHQLDGSWAKDAHDVANQIKPYMDDPYFASAFYGKLGPQMTQLLPSFLYNSGSKTGADDLAVYSHALGTAVSNQNDDPGVAAVANAFLTKPADLPVSLNRAAMVSNGDFPPDWLAQAARVNALDDFAQHGPNGNNGFGFDTIGGQEWTTLGQPSNSVAAWTQDLGRNPQAAREALATMGSGSSDVHISGDPTDAYQRNIHSLIAYGKADDYPGDVASGSAAAFQAASGANDEQDGAHSAGAATFAHALFDDLQKDSGDVQPIAATSFAKISGSYVQEMAAGAAQANDAGSGALPGTHPAFAVSPEETRNVLKSFVGDAGATKLFDDAAGTQMHSAQVAAARLDASAPAADAHNLERTSNAFGAVAGAENTATREVVGERDESQEHQNELIRSILSAGVDLIPGEKIAEAVPGTVWDIAKHVTNMGLEQVYGQTADPRFDALNDTSHAMAVTGAYEQLSVLHEAGYPGTQGVPSALLDPSTGQMLPVSKVLSTPDLQVAFHTYMQQQAQQHGTNTVSIYDETTRSANGYQGGFDTYDEH